MAPWIKEDLFGCESPSPPIVAPTGLNGLQRFRGDVALARAPPPASRSPSARLPTCGWRTPNEGNSRSRSHAKSVKESFSGPGVETCPE